MQFQASKVLPLLYFIFVSFCSADGSGRPMDMPKDNRGIVVGGANCANKRFSAAEIYRILDKGTRYVKSTLISNPNRKDDHYFKPSGGPKVPFTGPFYKETLGLAVPLSTDPNVKRQFYIIYTGDGKLVNVVHKTPIRGTTRSRYSNCDLEYPSKSAGKERPKEIPKNSSKTGVVVQQKE
ncbi:hypothetical protein EV44_g0586 [Erysiphe necator]|uniref:Uncharacterized protein n=1 Tax=Uncinula necator TaxID=52586 RepID=A0A0B1P6E9_UNCNE|nr:hypothetical protein EV44_g0586 [Erysiphe necator]